MELRDAAELACSVETATFHHIARIVLRINDVSANAVGHANMSSHQSAAFKMQTVVQVGVKMQFQGAQGQLLLFFGNKAATPLERLLCVVPPVAQFAFQLGPLPPRLDSKKQIQVCCPFRFWRAEHLSLRDTLCIVSTVAMVVDVLTCVHIGM